MKKKKALAAALALGMALSALPAAMAAEEYPDAHTIVLSSAADKNGRYTHSVKIDGADAEEFDYVWHADPAQVHDEVKNAPAEYYTGTAPDTDAAAYIAHDIVYFPQLPTDGFKRVSYDGENEWAYYYPTEEYKDYIFALLPVQGTAVPESMMHTEAEAYEDAVLHITRPGTYILKGTWQGQIRVDLGEDAFTDESARVTLVLDGVDVTCKTAPALVFYSAYECDNAWESRETYSSTVDTSDAGANVIIADGTVNSFTGANIYRMLKAEYKKDQEGVAVPVQKKQRKVDAPFYSYVSMNIDGEKDDSGVLNVTSSFEGLDTELHLTFNGGNVNIYSQDDGINVNEDGVSVVTFNGGSVHVLAGLGSEGDGIDSNGYLVVNGGTLVSMANPRSDSGMDSDGGTYVNGGTVVALGSTMDWAESDETGKKGDQAVMNLQFAASQSADEAIIVTDTAGKAVFAYDPDKDEVAGSNARWYTGAIVSAPGMAVGSDYYVYVGGDVTGTESAGVYDVSTVTGFTGGAKQQCWSAAGDLGGFRGFRPGEEGPEGIARGQRGQRPEGFDPSQMGQVPEGFDPSQMGQPPESFDPSQMGQPPEGFDPSQMGQPPEGFDPSQMGQPPEGFDPSQMGENGRMGGRGFGQNVAANGNGTREFTMEDRVNGFQGVTDYTGIGPAKFTDVAADSPFAAAIDWAVEQGITKGTTETTFSPSATCTHNHILTFLWRAQGSPAVSAETDPFGGAVNLDSDFGKAALWARANGLIDEEAYEPAAPCTRSQAVTYLWKIAGSPAAERAASFADVPASSPSASAVAWALSKGITNGTTEITFSPDTPCTRGQIVTFLYRNLGRAN